MTVQFKGREPLLGILENVKFVAEPFKYFAYDLPDFRVIFDHKDTWHGEPS